MTRMSCGRFLDYVEKLDESPPSTSTTVVTNAVVEAVDDPDLDNRVQRLRVDLPGLAPS